MSDINNADLADKVVETFKQRLSKEALARLSDTDFNELNALVHEALSEQKKAIVEMLEGELKRLRAETDRAEMEL
jgi:hypothetical protein